jgi:hypothetical protein
MTLHNYESHGRNAGKFLPEKAVILYSQDLSFYGASHTAVFIFYPLKGS